MGAVGQERFDGGEPQRDGPRRVVAVVGHPCDPGFQVSPVEVLEADVCSLDLRAVGKVGKEAFQADTVGLDRFRGEPTGLGHVAVQVVPGKDEEVRRVGPRVTFHSNPTSGNSDWLSLVMCE